MRIGVAVELPPRPHHYLLRPGVTTTSRAAESWTAWTNQRLDAISRLRGRFVFPYPHDLPTQLGQFSGRSPVALNIAIKFLAPPCRVVPRG